MGDKEGRRNGRKVPFFLEEERWSKDKPGLQLSWRRLRGDKQALPPTCPGPPPRFTSLNRKEISASASSSRLQVLSCCHKQNPNRNGKARPKCSAGISTCFPFGGVKVCLEVAPQILLICNDLSISLGSAHSQLIAIFEITLSTSAVKDFISLVTTTTKICTRGPSRHVHTHPSAATPTSFYSKVNTTLSLRCCISARL